MDRVAVFVDAGYLFAQGAKAILGTDILHIDGVAVGALIGRLGSACQ